jgi:peroxin-14
MTEMLEKNKDTQAQSLAELQQEMKSLKALLLSRGPAIPTASVSPLPSFSGRPSIPAWQLATGSSSPPAASWERAPAGSIDLNGKGKEIDPTVYDS